MGFFNFTKKNTSHNSAQAISDLYEITNNLEQGHIISLGEGLMTIITVMGAALIRGVQLDKNSPKGPLLIIGKEKYGRLPQELITTDAGNNITSINWVTYQPDLLLKIQQDAQLASPSRVEKRACFKRIASNTMKP